MLIKLAKVNFSEDRRPSRYKVWSVDTVILSIRDPGLILLGVIRWFKVNLIVWSDDPLDTRSISPVKIRDPLDTRSQSHMIFRRPSWYKVWSEDTAILSIQDPDLILFGVTYWFTVDLIAWSDDPLDTRSRSLVKICNPLVRKRSRLESRISFCIKWHTTLLSLHKVKVSAMIGCVALSSSRGQGYDIIVLVLFSLKIFSFRTKSVVFIFTYLLL